MSVIMILVSLALVLCAAPASAQKTYAVNVSVHNDLPEITPDEAQKILADASKILQKGPDHKDWDDDVACNVAFTLHGPIGTFDPPRKIVRGDLDIKALHSVNAVAGADFYVKVVERIHFCRGLHSSNMHGCAYPPGGRTIVVVHPKMHKDREDHIIADYPNHVLWAHEFGHLVGLGHRISKRALMKCGGVTDVSVRVTRHECRCLLVGPGPSSCQLPPAQWC